MAKVNVVLDFPNLTIQEMEDRDFFEQMGDELVIDDEFVIVDRTFLKTWYEDNDFYVFRVLDKYDD